MNKKRKGIQSCMSWFLVLSFVLSGVFTSDIVYAGVIRDENLWTDEDSKSMEFFYMDESINMETSGKKVFLKQIGGRQEALTVYSPQWWNQLEEAKKTQLDPSEYLKAVDVDKEFEAMATLEMFFVPDLWADMNEFWEIGGVRSDNIAMVRSKDEHVFRLIQVPIDENKIAELQKRLELYWRTEEGIYAQYGDGGFYIVDTQITDTQITDTQENEVNVPLNELGSPEVKLQPMIKPIVDTDGISVKFQMKQTNPEATLEWSKEDREKEEPSKFISMRIDLYLKLKIPPLSEFSEAVASEQQKQLTIVNRGFALQKHHAAPTTPSLPENDTEPLQPITESETTSPATSPQTSSTISEQTSTEISSTFSETEVSPTTSEAEIPNSPEQPENDVTDIVPTMPISEVPHVNPPVNVPFVPIVIENIDRIPPVPNPIFEIINEEGVPLGYAMIDVPQGQYIFVEDEVVPMGTAKIKNDNTLEILDESIPLGLTLSNPPELTLSNPLVATLPKTGQADQAFWFYGLGLLSMALGTVLIKNKR